MKLDVARLESFIMEKMSKTRIPGLSIAVVEKDRVVYSKGFGYRDVENGLRATPATLYGIGSVTKSFTALAIMRLVEQGKLSLDDPVHKYLPQFEIRPFGEPIRIVHLLSHSSGIPALAYAEALIDRIVGNEPAWSPIVGCDDVIAFMRRAGEWVEARPGEKFFYLNEGYVLLGCVVEKVSGMSYEDFVKREILEPLEMRRSFFKKEEVEKDPDVAAPYAVDKEGRWVRSRFPYGVTADGGLISNVLDLSNYISMYLGRGVFKGREVFSRSSIEEVEKPRIKLPYEVFGGESYALGWRVVPNFLGYRLVNHGGSVLVYTAYVGYVPEAGVGVAVLQNVAAYPPSYIGMYALALALGKDPERELPFIKMDRVFDRLVGVYETYMGTMKLEVVRRGDTLYIERRGRLSQMSIPLILEELDEENPRFSVQSGTARIPVEFRIRDGSVEMIYERYKLRKVGGLPPR